MAKVELREVTKIFNRSVEAVKEMNMVIEDKKVVCLLGPSGCGKTTTMRMIAGLETPTRGRIFFNDQDVTFLSASERDVAMVFQFPTVYPNLSAWENLALPLRGKKEFTESMIKSKVNEVLEGLHFPPDMVYKKAGVLGPGLRQKLAIGRAVIRSPRVFLFDEPLSHLDATTRFELMALIKHLSRDVGQTFVYVTHDQSEAMSLADYIAVMKDGELLQYDDPDTIYEWPRNTFVGWFLGNPGMNYIKCSLQEEEGALWAVFGKNKIDISMFKKRLTEVKSKEVILGIRPEYVRLVNSSQGDSVKGVCKLVEFVGGRVVIHVDLGGTMIRVKEYPQNEPPEDTPVSLQFLSDKLRLFNLDGHTLCNSRA